MDDGDRKEIKFNGGREMTKIESTYNREHLIVLIEARTGSMPNMPYHLIETEDLKKIAMGIYHYDSNPAIAVLVNKLGN